MSCNGFTSERVMSHQATLKKNRKGSIVEEEAGFAVAPPCTCAFKRLVWNGEGKWNVLAFKVEDRNVDNRSNEKEQTKGANSMGSTRGRPHS